VIGIVCLPGVASLLALHLQVLSILCVAECWNRSASQLGAVLGNWDLYPRFLDSAADWS